MSLKLIELLAAGWIINRHSKLPVFQIHIFVTSPDSRTIRGQVIKIVLWKLSYHRFVQSHTQLGTDLKWGIYCGIVNANVGYNSTTVHPFQYVRRCPRMSQLFVSYLQWLTIEAALTKATKFLPTKPSVNSHQVLDF